MNVPYIPLMIMFIVFNFAFIDWHARFVFVLGVYPRRYGHGKSGGRAFKHYKKNWSIFQRLLWIPVFKEWYERKHRFMAYLSYIHAFLTVVTVAFFLISVYHFPNFRIWAYEFAGYTAFFVLRFCYNNAIGKGDI